MSGMDFLSKIDSALQNEDWQQASSVFFLTMEMALENGVLENNDPQESSNLRRAYEILRDDPRLPTDIKARLNVYTSAYERLSADNDRHRYTPKLGI